jgi:hypothetical protein
MLFYAAVAIVAVYVVFAAVTFGKAGDHDVRHSWEHYVYVLLGIEAIAYTAVGWLFGREVHRGEAQAARKDAAGAHHRASQERERADQAHQHAAQADTRAARAEERGHALAAAVRAHRPAAGPQVELSEAEGSPAPATADDPLSRIADELFPE